ncbi:MAG: glycosyltransferase [Ignavibacteria bacterium]|nr:glycosyltransferase [Ignavibacteria bacterium]
MKVTVWMSAYNHAKYISRCLDSVISQKTDFEFDIVLGEDCSADDTRKIVLSYKEKYPGKFKLYLPEKNIGMMRMDMATQPMCTGEYLALLNGDDYWTDENKLQIQADFLDRNTDTVMCFHKATVMNEDTGHEFETVYLEETDVLPPESLLLGYNPIMTPTVMMRNILPLPDWYCEMPYGDMLTYLLLAAKGKIRYIDKNMSIYRIHESGQWQGDSLYNNLLKDLKFYRHMRGQVNGKYSRFIDRIFAQRYFDIVLHHIRENDLASAKRYFRKLVMTDRGFAKDNAKDLVRIYSILFEGRDPKEFSELTERPVKWKVN